MRATLLTMHLRDFSRAAPAASASVPCGYAAQKVSRAGARRPGRARCAAVHTAASGRPRAASGPSSGTRMVRGQRRLSGGPARGRGRAPRGVQPHHRPRGVPRDPARRRQGHEDRHGERDRDRPCGRLGQEGGRLQGPPTIVMATAPAAKRASADQSRRGADGAQAAPPGPEDERRAERGGGHGECEPHRGREPDGLDHARRGIRHGHGKNGRDPEALHHGRVLAGDSAQPAPQQVLVDDPRDGDRQSRRGGQERGEGATREGAESSLPPCRAGQRWAGRGRSRRAALPRAGLAGRPVEDAVDRREE